MAAEPERILGLIMQPLFFGNSNHPLYGVYHKPHRANDLAPRAVVICSPLGQEYIRSHWNGKLLAKQLARSGAHVLRFDLTGHGDSAGKIRDLKSLQPWINDVGQAIAWVRKKSNADNVMLIGLRFGATLSALTAMQRDDVHSLVAWEPVVDGLSYLRNLRTMHAKMMDLWVTAMKTPNDLEKEEILGFNFKRQLLDEIEQTKLDLSKLYLPQLIVDLKSNRQSFSHTEPSLQRVVRTDDEAAWNQLLTMETAWLRPQTNRLIVKTVADMFDRLKRIGALTVSNDNEMVGAV